MWLMLLADARGDPMTRPEIIWGTVALTAAMLAGAGVIYAVDKWRKRAAAGVQDETAALSDYRAMYEAGEITEAEYAELKRRVAEKVRTPAPAARAGGPAATPLAPPPAPPESPPPPPTA